MSIVTPSLRGLSGAGVAPLQQFPLFAALVGGITTTGFVLTAKTLGAEINPLNLEISADPGFGSGVITVAGSALAANGYWGRFTVSGLLPGTRYYTRLRNGALVGNKAPTVRTWNDGAQNLVIAIGSCNNQGQDPITWDRIKARAPDLLLHMGDLHYADVVTDDVALNQQYQDDVIGRTRSHAVFGNGTVPIVYQPNDHDSGTNIAGSAVQPAVHTAYRRIWPHYSLPAADAWYQSAVIGRVRLIVLDVRSKASTAAYGPDDVNKTLLGATQKAWLEAELLAAKTAGQAIIIAGGNGWCGGYSATPPVQDGWYDYKLGSRDPLLDYLVSQSIARACIVHGDMHGIAVDSGAYNQAQRSSLSGDAAIPVYGAAPFEASNSTRGSGWDIGTFVSQQRQYGLLRITDAGSTMTVRFEGYAADTDALLVSHERAFAM